MYSVLRAPYSASKSKHKRKHGDDASEHDRLHPPLAWLRGLGETWDLVLCRSATLLPGRNSWSVTTPDSFLKGRPPCCRRASRLVVFLFPCQLSVSKSGFGPMRPHLPNRTLKPATSSPSTLNSTFKRCEPSRLMGFSCGPVEGFAWLHVSGRLLQKIKIKIKHSQCFACQRMEVNMG